MNIKSNIMKNLFKKLQFLTVLVLAVSLLMISCDDKDDNPQDNPTETDFSENFGQSITRDFFGKVMDASHNPISGVTIEIGSATTSTDDNGVFVLKNAYVKERFAYIEAFKNGYLKGSRSVTPTDGENFIQIILLNEHVAGTVSSGTTGEVSLVNGTKVKFDGSFKDVNGNAYSGSVTVLMQHLDPSDPDINLKMPGMLYAQNSDNNERVLETFGMINVELRGSGGEILNIADGHTATIEVPADPTQTNAPNTIPLWHFDEANGYWIEDGTADLIGGKYIGQVSHFSWWNCDAPFPTVELCLTVVDQNGNPVSGCKIDLQEQNAIYPRTGYSNGNGEICGLIPANTTLNIIAYDACNNPIYTSSIGPFSSDTNIGTISIPATGTNTVTGTLLDCNNNIVTDGYIILRYDNYEVVTQVSNGDFSFNTVICSTTNNFSLEGIDNIAFQSTGIINYMFNTGGTNVGNLITCTTISEYVTYQIDNNTPVTFISNISASYYSGGNNYSISAQNGGANPTEWMYIGVTADQGVYAYQNGLSFEFTYADIDYNQPMTISASVNTNPVANIGDYIDINFGGTYTDTQGATRNINGVIHVLRDN